MIRLYKTTDKKHLVELIRINTPNYFAPSEEKDFIEYLDHLLEDYFVFEEDEKIVGCGGINYFLENNSARISWDMIHPDFHGKGIGKKLTHHRINKIKENPNINLIVVRTSQLANKFYGKMGFELKRVEKDFWAEGLDLYLMEINITP